MLYEIGSHLVLYVEFNPANDSFPSPIFFTIYRGKKKKKKYVYRG